MNILQFGYLFDPILQHEVTGKDSLSNSSSVDVSPALEAMKDHKVKVVIE